MNNIHIWELPTVGQVACVCSGVLQHFVVHTVDEHLRVRGTMSASSSVG